MTDYEKEAHAGQSNIRLSFVIVAPVLGRVEMVPTALLHDSDKACAREVNAGGQSLPAHCERARAARARAKLGADIVQLAAQLSPLSHDAFPRVAEAHALAGRRAGDARDR